MIFEYFIGITLCFVLSRADITTGFGNNLFSHKCHYFWRFPDQNFERNELMNTTFNGKECQAVQFSYVGRHGARFPEEGHLGKYNILRNTILQYSSKLDSKFAFLKNWKSWPELLEGITEYSGRDELIRIGKMYGNAFYDLFHDKISERTVKLSGSHFERTLESASIFFSGFAESINETHRAHITPVANNYVNQFFANCPNYHDGVQHNQTHLQEKNKFINSSYILEVIDNVAARLGMTEKFTYKDLKLMFELCVTELEVRNDTDWCTLQTEEEREILNYANDIQDYYTMWYGHPLIPKMACPMWEDLFANFDSTIRKRDQGQQYLLGDIHFGHSHTLAPFLTSIGLYNDNQPLRADSFDEMKNRTFYESKVMPSGGHVSFVLYNCGGLGPENYVIKLISNGNPTVIPRCKSDTCAFLKIKEAYNDYINNCQWKKYCTDPNPEIG